MRCAYGFWRWREGEVDAATAMLAAVREAGIDHLDTADVYDRGGSERLLGAIRARARSLFDGAVLATKAGAEPGSPYNSSRAYLTEACEASLKRLKVERVDLFYIHRPDLLTHPEELAGTLEALVASGKVGAIGVSNFAPSQVAALAHYLTLPIAVHQLEFSAVHVDPLFDGTLDQAMERDIAVAAWSPLAGGRLGEADTAVEPHVERVRTALAAFAAREGITASTAALAFVQRHPALPTPILGTKQVRRLRDAVSAGGFTMSRWDWYTIVEAWRGAKMP